MNKTQISARKFYIVPDSIPQSFNLINAVVYRYQHSNQYYAMGFSGRKSKPDFYASFTNEEDQESYIEAWVNNLTSHLNEKQKRFAIRKNFNHSLKVGDILYSSWGYDQTNIDFYEVTKIKSNKSVVICAIDAVAVEDGSMPGAILPRKGVYFGSELVKKVGVGNRITLGNHTDAYIWDGLPKYCSWGAH